MAVQSDAQHSPAGQPWPGHHPHTAAGDYLPSCQLVLRIYYFNVDQGPSFHFNADPDPASHQSDANLRPLVYKPAGLHFCAPIALHGSILSLQSS